MARSVALVGFLFGLAAVLLQFGLTMPASMAAGRSLAGSLAFFFTFFTILTNILVVLVYAGATFGGRLAWFARPPVAAGAAVAIAVVGIVYATVLARLWDPQGLHLVANVMLHYIAPPLFLVWWLGLWRDGSSRFADVPKWLAYPLVYLGVVLARGAFVHEYPYPFLDPAPNGAGSVAIACAAIFGLFVVVAALIVIADRTLPAPRR
jgi:hypothetical protein